MRCHYLVLSTMNMRRPYRRVRQSACLSHTYPMYGWRTHWYCKHANFMAMRKTSNTSLFSIGYIQLFLWLNWTTVAIATTTTTANHITQMFFSHSFLHARALYLNRNENNVCWINNGVWHALPIPLKNQQCAPRAESMQYSFSMRGLCDSFLRELLHWNHFSACVLHPIHTYPDSLDLNIKHEITLRNLLRRRHRQ